MEHLLRLASSAIAQSEERATVATEAKRAQLSPTRSLSPTKPRLRVETWWAIAASVLALLVFGLVRGRLETQTIVESSQPERVVVPSQATQPPADSQSGLAMQRERPDPTTTAKVEARVVPASETTHGSLSDRGADLNLLASDTEERLATTSLPLASRPIALLDVGSTLPALRALGEGRMAPPAVALTDSDVAAEPIRFVDFYSEDEVTVMAWAAGTEELTLLAEAYNEGFAY